MVPLSSGVNYYRTSLCSCSLGQFPANFLQHLELLELLELDHVLEKYAARIAIVPIFPVPYEEDCFNCAAAYGEDKRSS